jgi:general secretion pathway protein I
MKTGQRGFTLLEVLIALAVLAVALGAIFSAAGSYTGNQAYLRDRTFAQWVARNQLATVQLSGRWPSIGQEKGEASLPEAGSEVGQAREWRWEMQVTQTTEENLRRLDIDVYPRNAGDDAEPMATLSGLVKKPV